MAIGTPVERHFVELSAQLGTSVISPAATLTAGTFQVMPVFSNGNKSLSSVTDSKGNTWTVDGGNSDGTRSLAFASCRVATTILTSDTITLTWGNSSSSTVTIWIQEVSGIVTSSAFDKLTFGTGTGTALTAGPTLTLAQADEIVFAQTRSAGGGTWTKDATYSNPTTPASTVSTGSSLEYKIVSATTGVSATGTWSVSGAWIVVIATYKAAPAAQTRNVAGWITRS